MALEIKQALRLAQQLVVTPQLQQAIKLLQLSRLELENLIQHELLENPVLEEREETPSPEEEEVSITEPMALAHDVHDKEQRQEEVGTKDGVLKEPTNFDWENYLGTYNAHEGIRTPGGGGEASEELPSYESRASVVPTLQDHLLWQLHLSDFADEEARIAEQIIGNIDEDGYFKGDLSEIASQNGGSPEIAMRVLSRIQEFDPPGVASRNLVECLKRQIRPFEQDAPLLEKIIELHLEDLERKNHRAIVKSLGVSMEKLKELAHILSTLEPKPARPFSGEKTQYIIPDVFVHKVGSEYIVVLNDDGLPKLQVSSFYRSALMKNDLPSNAKDYIHEKLQSAFWLIRSIHQRQRTLYRVAQSIVKFQKGFLDHGVSHLKPMVLRDVAQDIEMHESTISRVTTNKFVQTSRGLFELKFFFNSKVPSSSGDGMTSEAVREAIRLIVGREDSKKPLSDQQIVELLKTQSIAISRRTVAKYREMMRIDPSSRRRQAF